MKFLRNIIEKYSISIIFNEINKRNLNKTIDFKYIWNNQKINDALEKQLLITTKETFDFINKDDRLTLNVTEWCKKEACWDRAKKESFTLLDEFIDSLIDADDERYDEITAKKERKVINQLNAEIEVVTLGEDYWKKTLNFGLANKLLTPMEEDLLKIASSFTKNNKIPSTKQANIILEIRKKLLEEGLPKE